jgi:hypothetical protein
MLMHEFMWRQVQLLSYLDSGYIRRTIELPTVQEKSEQIFFTQPVYGETNKTVTTYLLWLITFFEQCQAANKWLASLTRSRRKNNQKRRRWLIFTLLAAVN